MRKYGYEIAGGLFVALISLLLLFPEEGRSQELPEGVSLVVLSEHESSTPGVAKVRLVKFTFQPGAVRENFTLPFTVLCNTTKGTFTVVNHTHGITNQYPPGARRVNQKGWTLSIYNKGDEPAVMWAWQMIPEE